MRILAEDYVYAPAQTVPSNDIAQTVPSNEMEPEIPSKEMEPKLRDPWGPAEIPSKKGPPIPQLLLAI